MEGVRLALLGPVDLTVDGEPRAPQRALARGVLALLGAHRTGALSQDRLADSLVEAGLCEAMSRNGLQAQVSRLRDRLGRHADLLRHSPGGYRLHGEGLARDVDLLDELLAAGASARASGDAAAALQHHTKALALFRGGYCEDLPDLRLLDSSRARYERLALELVEEAAGDRLLLGGRARLDEAVTLLEDQVAREPLRERSWSWLVAALWQVGRQADALAAYDRARRVLAEEAGLDPGPQLRRVQQAVLEQVDSDDLLDLLDLGSRPGDVPALVWLDGRGEPRRRFLTRDASTTIGRHEKVTVRLDHPSVAAWHATVRPDGPGWTLAGLDCPVVLNGAPVDRAPLVPGDVIRCGDVALMVATSPR